MSSDMEGADYRRVLAAFLRAVGAPLACPLTGDPACSLLRRTDGDLVVLYGGARWAHTIALRQACGGWTCDRYALRDGRWVMEPRPAAASVAIEGG